MRRVDIVLGWASAVGGALAMLFVMATGEWVSLGMLLGIVLLANAAVRLRLAREGRARREAQVK